MLVGNSAATHFSFANQGKEPGERIRLDRALPADEPLLYQTFASTRTEEMELTGWSSEQQE